MIAAELEKQDSFKVESLHFNKINKRDKCHTKDKRFFISNHLRNSNSADFISFQHQSAGSLYIYIRKSIKIFCK